MTGISIKSNLPRSALIALALAATLVTALTASGLIANLEDKVGTSLAFKARSLLDADPKLDPRIKIIAFDDDTVSRIGIPESLSTERWTKFYANLAATKPSHIVVDMIYGARRSKEELQQLQQALSASEKIHTAALLSRAPISYRGAIDVTSAAFRQSDQAYEYFNHYRNMFTGIHVYAADPELSTINDRVGHINFRSPGWISPLAFVSASAAIPHLSLRVAESIAIKHKTLVVNDNVIPLNPRAELLLNWPSKSELFRRSKRAAKFFDQLPLQQSGQDLLGISPGDIVIVLPAMYTGNTDFKETHIGEIPGGYALVASINSVLSGKWLHPVDTGNWGLAIAFLFGCAFLIQMRLPLAVALIVSTNIFYALVVTGLFSIFNMQLPWVGFAIAFNLAALSALTMTAAAREYRVNQINAALKGVVSNKVLAKVSADPSKVKVESSEVVVTTMFVDFVGFSTAAERLSPNLVFNSLKTNLTRISAIIHEHGGIVDKTLGDGLIGFFGFDPLSSQASQDHADKAVLCAITIQQELAKLCAANTNDELPVFPARIGLNSGTVYIGNIGDQDNIEITVIGHAVNMAKRYEDAAEPFRVMIGRSTKQRMTESLRALTPILRRAQIKHHDELVDVYEIDPFHDHQALQQEALASYRKAAGISREHVRHLIPGEISIQIVVDGKTQGRLIDYSAGGVAVELSTYLARKVKFKFDLIFTKNGLDQRLENLESEIRWGRKSSDQKFRHGLALNTESQTRLDQLLRDYKVFTGNRNAA